MRACAAFAAAALSAWPAAAADAPAVIWVSDPVRPGETVMILGHAFTKDTVVEASPSVGQPMQKLPILDRSEQCVKALVPGQWQPDVFELQVRTEAGQTAKVLLNRADPLWWVGDQGDRQTPGRPFRICGKNLVGPDPKAVRVRLTGPKAVDIPVRKAEPFALTATLPPDVAPGDYPLQVHNGWGAQSGWSTPLALTVVQAKPWPETVFNVMDFGATGRCQQDDTPAIQAALAKAKAAGGGIVYFPRGRYEVRDTLEVPRFTVLKGQKQEWVELLWPDLPKPVVLVRGTNTFGLEEITLTARNYLDGIVSDIGSKPEAGDVFLRRVRVRAMRYLRHLKPEEIHERFVQASRHNQGGDTVCLGGRNVEITDCDLYGCGRGLVLAIVKGGRVTGTTIHNGRWGWYCFSGLDGLVFENNTIIGADPQATGGGLNTFYGAPYSRNVYYAHNTLRTMFGWDREAMTSDAGGGAYAGPIESCQGTSLVLSAQPPRISGVSIGTARPGMAVYILAGRGAGQFRQVVQQEGRRVTVDRPWVVEPDQTSLLSITMLQQNYFLIGNDFSDATIAIQAYGISIGHIIAGNASARAGGFHVMGLNYHGIQPSWFCQMLDNRITEGNGIVGPLNEVPPRDSHIAAYGSVIQELGVPMNRCPVIRRNQLLNNARLELLGAVQDAVVEHNRVENADVGVHIDPTVAGALVRENQFVNVRQPLTGAGLSQAAIHPAALALARVQGLLALVADRLPKDSPVDCTAATRTLEALAARPADDPALPEACRQAFEKALEIVARACPRPVGLELLTALGLEVHQPDTKAVDALVDGSSGGKGAIQVRVTSGPLSPEAAVTVRALVPPGWKADPAAGRLAPGATMALSVPVEVPAGAWGVWTVPIEIDVALGRTVIGALRTATVGTGAIRDWAVVGPFPNKDRQALDSTGWPPETRLDLAAQYDGASGKVAWSAYRLKQNRLDLAALLNPNEYATAYALACLKREQAGPVVLSAAGDEGFIVWCNDELVLRRDHPRPADRLEAAVDLKAGENFILCLSTTTTGPWWLELGVRQAGSPGALRVLPAETLKTLPALNPPPLSAPATSQPEITHAFGRNWQLVFADDFQRLQLGRDWKVISGSWSIDRGVLVGQSAAIIGWAKPIRPPLRLEYDASSDEPGDLSAVWIRSTGDWSSGYFVGFGSGGNTQNKIVRYGQHVAEGTAPLIVKGRKHHVIVQIVHGTVQLIVDGRLALQYRDPEPVRDADTVGLCAWSVGRFDNVRIYRAD